MPNPGKGGRAKEAPYKTVHYRIPEHIKPLVELLANRFRELVGSGAIRPAREEALKKVDKDKFLKDVLITLSNSDNELSSVHYKQLSLKVDTNYNDEKNNEQDDQEESEENKQEESEEDDNDQEANGSADEIIQERDLTIKRQAETNQKLLLEVKILEREKNELTNKVQKLNDIIQEWTTKAQGKTAKQFPRWDYAIKLLAELTKGVSK